MHSSCHRRRRLGHARTRESVTIRASTLSVVSINDSPDSVEQGERMPRWVPRAVVIFWLGYLGMVASRYTFHRLSSLLILLLVSLFLALALEPAVNRMVQRGWKRGTATLTLLLLLLAGVLVFVGAIGTVVGQQVADLLANSEKYVNDTVRIINDTFNTRIDPASVNDRIADPNGPVQQFIRSQSDSVFKLSVTAIGYLFQGLSVMLFSFYMVADGPRLRRSICSRLVPSRQRKVLDAWELAITKTGGYLYSRVLLALVSAFFHWVALQAIGSPAPIAMALWVGLVSQFLPVIGTYLAGVLPALLTLVDSPTRAIAVVAFILVYQQVENYLIAPKVTQRTLELHPALAFGGALAGGAVLGAVGAILALPAVAMIQALVSAWGTRHEVIDDPLTHVHPPRPRRRRRRGGGWQDPT